MQIIPKYQSGGYVNMFTSYDSMYNNRRSYLDETDTKSSKKSSDSSEKGQLTEKDFFSMLEKVIALPNERRAIISQLMDVFSENILLGRDTSDIRMLYLQTLDQISQASANKDIYDEAIKSVITNDAGGDVAISQSGKLVTLNSKGDLGYISLEEYYDDPESYTLISNSDLANFRRNSSSFINDQQAFDILQNAMSYKVFQQYVDQAKVSLGSNEFKSQGYIDSSSQQQALEGLKALQQVSEKGALQAQSQISANSLYKWGITSKEQTNQIKHLVQYITRALPEKLKTWASLKTSIKDGNKALESLIINYLGAQHTSSYDFTIDDEKTKKSSEGNDSETGLEKLDLNNASRFVLGLGSPEEFVINPGSTTNVAVNATTLPLTNSEKKNLGPMCSLQEVMQGEFGGSLDLSNATLGGFKIPIQKLDEIIVDDGQIYSIDYPVKEDGTPDFSSNTSAKYQKAIQQLKDKGININNKQSRDNNIETINQVMKDNDLSIIYDNEGNLIQGSWKRFAVMNVSAFDTSLGIDDYPGSLLQEVTDGSVAEDYENVIKEKKKGFNVDVTSWNDILGYNELYQGTLFIPIKTNILNALSSTQMTGYEANAVDAASQIAQYRNDLIKQQYNKGAEF